MSDFFAKLNIHKPLISLLFAGIASVLVGCSDNTGSSGTSTSTPVQTVATLQLSAAPTTIRSDNLSFTTITVTAVDAANVVVAGAKVNFSANAGSLNKGFVTTDSAGVGTLTFTSGTNQSNRVATITASVGGATANLPVQIVGSTVVVNPTSATLPDNGTSTVTLNISVKDAAGAAIDSPAVVLTVGSAGAGAVTLAPACNVTAPCTANASGNLSVTATGVTAGAVTVTVAAVGATSTSALTVSPSTATFAIDQLILTTPLPSTKVTVGNPLLTAMKIGDTLDVRVNAPAANNVVFVTSMGKWNGVSNTATVPVVSGKATASLTTAVAGVASISVFDSAAVSSSDALSVSMTAATPAIISIQASPAVVKTNGVSTLTATVLDANYYPVGDVQVSFEILNPSGGGEKVVPTFATTTSIATTTVESGAASVSFTAGSKTSTGIQVRASVVGYPSVVTEAAGLNVTASGNDAAISINGQASSVTFGQATVLQENANLSGYVLPMNITVADNNGNAVAGAEVSLSAWPIAWSTSSTPCAYDPDTPTTGTYYNEDTNENFNLEAAEDGVRTFYTPISAVLNNTTIVTPRSAGGFNGLAKGMKVAGVGIQAGTTISNITYDAVTAAATDITLSNSATLTTTTSLTFSAIGGTVDSLITPPNAAAGTLPASVTTDANGQALFSLNYTKSNALWIVDRIRATTKVTGSQAVGETTFRLSALEKDVKPCRLLPSPYNF